MSKLEDINNQLKGIKANRPIVKDVSIAVNTQNAETLKKKSVSSLGGKRAGSGRKPGVSSQKTLDKIAVLKAYRERAMKHAEGLLNSQLMLAKGVNYLFKITPLSKKPVLVVDPKEIADYLDKCNGEAGASINGEYYYITAAKPDAGVIVDILDRTFGRAAQPIKGDSEDDTPIGLHIANLDDLLKKAYDSD